MNSGLTITCPVHFQSGRRGKRELQDGPPPVVPPTTGRVPHLARLMALAIRLSHLLETGAVADMAEVARLGHVTRARVTQIINLRFLAPDIQEDLLFLPLTEAGRDCLKEWQVRPIAATPSWSRQRRMWRELKAVALGGDSVP